MGEKELNDLIALNISKLMENRNVTQKELAEYIGVSQATVSNWISGTKTPRMDKIDKICNFFDVSRSRLMGLDEESDDDDEQHVFSEVDDMTNELFEKHKLLFSKTKNATVNDMKKIIAIVDALMGENNNE